MAIRSIAMQNLKEFILINVGTDALKSQIALLHKKIAYMKFKFKSKMAVRYSKIDMLMKYWDKTLNYMQFKSKMLCDTRITGLC